MCFSIATSPGVALLNIIMSAKFLSIFRNMKNSCLVSLWSSTCHFICYICVCERGGGEGEIVHVCIMAVWCVRVCVREREGERDCMCAS